MSASDGDRLAALEVAVEGLYESVTTRRLVVVDAAGRPRLVAEVRGGTVELRLEVPSLDDEVTAAVVLHAGTDGLGTASPGTDGPGTDGPGTDGPGTDGPGTDGPGEGGLGPMAGLQLWANGDAVIELDAWPGDDGRWRPHVSLGGPS